MSLIVQKYGGTSVGDVDRIKGVAQRVKSYVDQGHQVVVVVSAMSGETNKLVGLGEAISEGQPNAREMDVLTSSGEQVTIALLSMALQDLGVGAQSMLADQVGIKTNNRHGRARITDIEVASLHAVIDRGAVPVVAGFQGVDEDGNITTLGRGGSDTSAVALAAILKADECEICTDVDGVYTADPRLVDSARKMERVTFEEMLELASLGSKVLHSRSVEFAGRYQVPLRVVSTFESDGGTLITIEGESMEQPMRPQMYQTHHDQAS